LARKRSNAAVAKRTVAMPVIKLDAAGYRLGHYCDTKIVSTLPVLGLAGRVVPVTTLGIHDVDSNYVLIRPSGEVEWSADDGNVQEVLESVEAFNNRPMPGEPWDRDATPTSLPARTASYRAGELEWRNRDREGRSNSPELALREEGDGR